MDPKVAAAAARDVQFPCGVLAASSPHPLGLFGEKLPLASFSVMAAEQHNMTIIYNDENDKQLQLLLMIYRFSPITEDCIKKLIHKTCAT